MTDPTFTPFDVSYRLQSDRIDSVRVSHHHPFFQEALFVGDTLISGLPESQRCNYALFDLVIKVWVLPTGRGSWGVYVCSAVDNGQILTISLQIYKWGHLSSNVQRPTSHICRIGGCRGFSHKHSLFSFLTTYTPT